MKGYLLDTNMLAHYEGRHPNVVAKVASLAADDIIKVSVITLGEIAFGHALTNSTDQARRDEFERWINNEFPTARVLPVRRSTRMHYGELKARLFKAFPANSPRENHPERCIDRATGAELGIDENDLWIASQAIEHNLGSSELSVLHP